MSWWVHIDFGSDHQIVESDECPGFSGEWDGPFDTFTEARKHILFVGSSYIRDLQSRQRWWRETSKAEILLMSDHTEGTP